MSKSEKKDVMGGFGWKMAEHVSSQGVSFIVSIILARLLSPAEFGVVAMVQIFIVLANVFITSGISSSLIQKKDADDIDFSTMLYCNMVISLLLYCILFFCAPAIASFYNMPELVTIVRVYGLVLIMYGYNSIQNAWVSRHMVFRKFFIATLSGTIVSGVIGVAMAYSGYGVWALIVQTMTNVFINMLVMRTIIAWRPQLVFSFIRAKRLCVYGVNMLTTQILGTGCEQLRQLLIGKIYTPADLALFNRGHHLSSFFSNSIDTSINAVLFPAMSNHSDNKDRIREMTRRSMCTCSYVLFFLLGMFIICAESVVKILLTEKWIECVPYLQLMCISNMLASVSTANLQAIKALGKSDICLRLELIKKPVFLLMTVAAANISVMAIAISMPLYAVYAAYINMSPNKKLLGYGFKEQTRDYAPATALLVLMFVIVYPTNYLDINVYFLLIFQIILCCIVYGIASYLFKVDTFNYLQKTIQNDLLRYINKK